MRQVCACMYVCMCVYVGSERHRLHIDEQLRARGHATGMYILYVYMCVSSLKGIDGTEKEETSN